MKVLDFSDLVAIQCLLLNGMEEGVECRPQKIQWWANLKYKGKGEGKEKKRGKKWE